LQVPYCSGDLYIGTLRERGAVFPVYSSGHTNLDDIIDHIHDSDLGLCTADDVLFTGQSAGGYGVFQNIDW
jgi:hypothetical protein